MATNPASSARCRCTLSLNHFLTVASRRIGCQGVPSDSQGALASDDQRHIVIRSSASTPRELHMRSPGAVRMFMRREIGTPWLTKSHRHEAVSQ